MGLFLRDVEESPQVANVIDPIRHIGCVEGLEIEGLEGFSPDHLGKDTIEENIHQRILIRFTERTKQLRVKGGDERRDSTLVGMMF